MKEYHCNDDIELFFRRLPTQRGSGMMDDGRMYFAGVRRQRGAGIGGIFGSIARRLLPFAQKYIMPHAMEYAKNVVNDLSEGRKIGESLKENASTAFKNAGQSFFNQYGKGVRRKRLSKRRSKVAKRKQPRKKRTAKRVQKKRNRTKAKAPRRKRKAAPALNTIFH